MLACPGIEAGRSFMSLRRAIFFGLAGALAACPLDHAAADKIKHAVAVFSGLDKITGRIISFEVGTNETVQFGSLQITERVCYTRPPTEAPQTDTFVEVDELAPDKTTKRIFTGWMFAASPGLHALDHPVYDIWLTGCKGTEEVIASPPSTAEAEPQQHPQGPAQQNSPQQTPPQQAAAPQQQAPQQAAAPPQPRPRRASAQAQSAPLSAPIEVGPPPGFVPPDSEPAPDAQQLPPPAMVPADGG